MKKNSKILLFVGLYLVIIITNYMLNGDEFYFLAPYYLRIFGSQLLGLIFHIIHLIIYFILAWIVFDYQKTNINIWRRRFIAIGAVIILRLVNFIIMLLPYYGLEAILRWTLRFGLDYTVFGARHFGSFISYDGSFRSFPISLSLIIFIFHNIIIFGFLVLFGNKLFNKPQVNNNLSKQIPVNHHDHNFFCKNCGQSIENSINFCPKCGTPVNSTINSSQSFINNDDTVSIGFNILSFAIPLVGLILYLIWNKEYPIKSKAIGLWSIVGVIFNVLLYVLFISIILENLFN